MTLREMLKTRAAKGGAVILVLLAVWAALRLWVPRPAPFAGLWYYDLTTGERMVLDVPSAQSPTVLPSGNQAVLARVFACGACGPDAFIGYLELFIPAPPPPAGKAPATAQMQRMVAAVPESGDEPGWFPADTPRGNAIIDSPRTRCGEVYRECIP